MFFKYKCGLDIGESVDHSAFCMIETRISDDLSELNSRGGRRITHHIVVLRRFDLSDKPEDVEDQLVEFFTRETFRNTGVVLAVETNSIGLRVFRQMRKKG